MASSLPTARKTDELYPPKAVLYAVCSPSNQPATPCVGGYGCTKSYVKLDAKKGAIARSQPGLSLHAIELASPWWWKSTSNLAKTCFAAGMAESSSAACGSAAVSTAGCRGSESS